MRRVTALSTILALCLGPACKQDTPAAGGEAKTDAKTDAKGDAKADTKLAAGDAKADAKPTPTGVDATPVAAVPRTQTPEPSYTAELDALLELVPAGAKYFAVVRDPGEFIDGFGWLIAEQKDMWTRVLDATKDPAKPDGDAGMRRVLTEYELVQTAFGTAGVHLDRGLVIIGGDGEDDKPTIAVLAADDAEAVPKMLRALSTKPDEEDTKCKTLDVAGMVACSSNAEALAAYAPGKDAKGARASIEAHLDTADVAHGNVVALVPSKDGPLAFSVLTAPGVVQFDLRLPQGKEFAAVDAPGPANTLALLSPGSSFMWTRLDAAALAKQAASAPAMVANMVKALSGEFLVASPGKLGGVSLLVGITDKTPIAGLIPMAGLAADKIPPLPDGSTVALKIEDIDDGGGSKQQVLRAIVTPGTELAKIKDAGLVPEVVSFVTSQYAAVSFGTGVGIVPDIARAELSGPSEALLAELPSELSKALKDSTASMVMHVELDGLHGPKLREQLAASLAGVPAAGPMPSSEAAGIALRSASPLSSFSMWNTAADDGMVMHFAMRSFGDPASDEGRAAQAARLDVDAGRKDHATAYGALVTAYPDSSRIASYRARAGMTEGGTTTGAAMVGMLTAIAVPAFQQYIARSKAAAPK
ncbi:MAG: hypothetical protein IPH07_39460 [Deltaproteobacteria bacterium]|nr:hypothetical protein [Deltaproteobacteria bacterium]MBK8713911.1 hypothetical protein [Deltaproteobacteria bacterium]MBP7289833.1 hypothetical protein [Nannocystaceae bacterium]